MDFTLKLCLKGKIKRVPTQSSYLTLCHTINDLFRLNNGIFSLYFFNEEQDRIGIENETDYHEALEFSLIQNVVLKIIIKLQSSSNREGEERLCLTRSDEEEEDETKYRQCNSCFRSFASNRSFMAHYHACEKLLARQAQKFDLNKMRLKAIACSNGIKMNTLINMSSDEDARETMEQCRECSKPIKACLYSQHLNKCKNKVKKRPRQPNNSIQNILLYDKMFLSNNFMNYLEKNKNEKRHNKAKGVLR